MIGTSKQICPVSFDQNIADVFSRTYANEFHYNPTYIQLLTAADTKMGLSRSGIQGTCMTFAPNNELARRDRVVSAKFEKGTIMSPNGEIFQLEPIKYYSRSAAGHTQNAEDILSAEALHRCIEYICRVLLLIPEKLGEESSEERSEFFTFLDNRLRSVGKDYESQSIAGYTHMRDMGMLFRIYIIRMLECTKTAADCENFSAFKKLNNERLDAIQGNLLKYIHDRRHVAFFNEIFPLFLLRSIGHDAELDARQWWSEIPATRRQMLFKMSISPLTQEIDSLTMFQAIQALHYVETAQWFAFCRHIHLESQRKLHVTLLSSALSYVRVRALMEIHSGRPIGAQKIRYTGTVSLSLLADALLFRDVDELKAFGACLNIIDVNFHSGMLQCGETMNPDIFFMKGSKQKLLRPLCMLPHTLRRHLVYGPSSNSESDIGHFFEQGTEILQLLERHIDFAGEKILQSVTEANQLTICHGNSFDDINTTLSSNQDFSRKEVGGLSSITTNKPRTPVGTDNQVEREILYHDYLSGSSVQVPKSYEISLFRESMMKVSVNQDDLCNEEIGFGSSESDEIQSRNSTNLCIAYQWLSESKRTPQWLLRACNYLSSLPGTPHRSSKLHLMWFWYPFLNAKLLEQEFTRMFNYKDHLVVTHSGHVIEIINERGRHQHTFPITQTKYTQMATFVSVFTSIEELQQIYRTVQEISRRKRFQAIQLAVLVTDSKEMSVVYDCVSKMSHEITIDVLAHTPVENIFEQRNTLEYTFESLCISSLRQMV